MLSNFHNYFIGRLSGKLLVKITVVIKDANTLQKPRNTTSRNISVIKIAAI